MQTAQTALWVVALLVIMAIAFDFMSALEQHLFDAIHMGAVRVFGLFALGVVLAVDGRPLFGHLTCGQPQPQAEKMGCDRVQVQRAVRLMTVQKHGDAYHGDVRHGQREQNDLPPGEVPRAMAQPFDGRIQHSPVR